MKMAEHKLDLAALVNVLKDAPDNVKTQLRNALGASGSITRKATPQNNSDAKRIAFTVGEALHPSGFTPEPSEAMQQSLGYDRAKEIISDSYLGNKNSTGAMSTITGRDADQMQTGGDPIATPQGSNMDMDAESLASLAVE
jgi:hypothetical protein|tara:strand:- start:3126 stop:3548 length:423 start_codon:yes stop_codon:yes gene_type:complete